MLDMACPELGTKLMSHVKTDLNRDTHKVKQSTLITQY